MNTNDLPAHLNAPARLAALRNIALLDTPTEEAFDRPIRLTVNSVNAPVSLVSLIDADRQYMKSAVGLPEPWRSRREMPLSHSFCQHNRVAGQHLLIEDGRIHPFFKDNPAIKELHVPIAESFSAAGNVLLSVFDEAGNIIASYWIH